MMSPGHIPGLDPSEPSQPSEELLYACSNPTTTVSLIIRDSRYAASLYFLAGSFFGRGFNGYICWALDTLTQRVYVTFCCQLKPNIACPSVY